MPGFEIEIRIESLDDVHVHEETIPELLEQMIHNIRLGGKIRDPLIIDSNTRVVLDGMHRVAALREIGCRYLPACLIDYRSPKVMVGCWHRVLSGRPWESKFLDFIKSLGLEAISSPLEEAFQDLEERKATAALLVGENCHLFKAPDNNIRESYEWIKRIEIAMKKEGFSIFYETKSDTEKLVKSGKVSAALLVPRVHKEEVLKAALSGNIFAHKTTRHILPVRPVNVGTTIELLRGDRTQDQVDSSLVEQLSKRKFERLPEGTLYEGQRYEEELLVFR